MENYSRRNQQMSNTVHELSHGSNTQKARPEFIPIVLFAISSFIFFSGKHQYGVALWFIGMFISLLIHFRNEPKPGNEPKTDRPKQITAVYMLDRAQLLCMLHNSQIKK